MFSLGVTAVYIATVAGDIQQHHWAAALDASRAAVPAAVGWAALLIVFFASGTRAAEQSRAAEHAAAERQSRAARARDSVRQAEKRVQSLAASLAVLSALAARADQNRQLAREIGDTIARLDQADQWLVCARAALDACQRHVAETARTPASGSGAEPGATARRVA